MTFLLCIFAVVLAFIGWVLLTNSSRRDSLFENDSASSRGKDGTKNFGTKNFDTRDYFRQIFGAVATFVLVLFGSLLVTTSLEISISLAFISTALPFLIAKNRSESRIKRRDRAWPEAIDYLISSLHSGQSITEAVVTLHRHGPGELQDVFERINRVVGGRATLEEALAFEMEVADSAVTDQVLTSLLYAKEYGGHDVANTLRLLASFLRDEAEMLEEIETRFGWVKNSGKLGAVAPWLLLALLSTQKSTVEAYSTAAGKIVLSIGIVATAASFIWMEKIAQLPKPARPFSAKGFTKPRLLEPRPLTSPEKSRGNSSGNTPGDFARHSKWGLNK